MKLIIEIEVSQQSERPFYGKEITVVTHSMHIETGKKELEPQTIAKARYNTNVLINIAEAVEKVISPLCRPMVFHPSTSHRGEQKDSQSQQPVQDWKKDK